MPSQWEAKPTTKGLTDHSLNNQPKYDDVIQLESITIATARQDGGTKMDVEQDGQM